jgi:hypothetical protein
MTNEPKTAPQAPASNAADQTAKSADHAKPIVTPVPAPEKSDETKKV